MIGVYAVRRALIDALAAKTVTGQPLEGWTVEYSAPSNLGLKCIYGGGIRFDHTPTVAEPNVLIDETATMALYLRAVARPPATVRDTDTLVEAGAAALTAVLVATPNLGGGVSWQGMSGGQGDYWTTDDEVGSTLALSVVLGKRVTYV